MGIYTCTCTCWCVALFLQATAEANNLNAQNAARDRYIKEMEKVRHQAILVHVVPTCPESEPSYAHCPLCSCVVQRLHTLLLRN